MCYCVTDLELGCCEWAQQVEVIQSWLLWVSLSKKPALLCDAERHGSECSRSAFLLHTAVLSALAAPAPLTPAAAKTVKARLDDVCPPDTTPRTRCSETPTTPPNSEYYMEALGCSKEVRGHTAPIEKDENGKIVL